MTPSAEAVFGIVNDPAVDPTELSADKTLARRSMSACIDQSNGLASLSPFRSWPDCIISTSGYDFSERTADCTINTSGFDFR